MDIRQLREFQTWGFDTRGWRRSTRERYAQQVRLADRWLRANCDVTLTRANYDDLETFHFSRPPTPSTRNTNRNALMAWFDYLIHRGSRSTNPARDLPRLKVRQSVPKALSTEAAAAIVQASYPEGPMWTAMIYLMLFQALRATEARTLEWTQVEDDGWLRVAGKGGRQRMLPLHGETMRIIETWHTFCPSPTYLFPSPRSEDRPVSTTTVNEAVKRIGDRAGVPELHPHMMRHTCATQLLESGADVRTVQEFLGHATLATTTIYLRVRPTRLVEAVGRLTYGAATGARGGV